MKKLLVLPIGLLFAGSAFAMPITFDFGASGTGSMINAPGAGSRNIYYAASMSGFLLSVTGYEGADLDPPGSNVSDEFDRQRQVHRDTGGSHQGLGVDSDPGDPSSRLNGNDQEALRFFLSAPGTLTQIVFNNWGSGDDFDFSMDGIAILNNFDPSGGIWNGSMSFQSLFAIGGDGNSDEFRVRSVTIDFANTPSVPEPGSLALLGIGLLAFGVTLRSRRR